MFLSNENATFSETSSNAMANGDNPETDQQATVRRLESIAKNIRRNIIKMIVEANSGHPGGSLSAVELLTVLYFQVLKHKPEQPTWEKRDRFVLSKAHACPVLYATLAEAGYFPSEELSTFRKINSRLQGHAHIKTPGVEMSGG